MWGFATLSWFLVVANVLNVAVSLVMPTAQLKPRVIVCDPASRFGVSILQESGFEVEVLTKVSNTALLEQVCSSHTPCAVIISSSNQIDRGFVEEACPTLVAVG